jgi:succinate dehydrogenase/fumarate reductase flavoprotein subunit
MAETDDRRGAFSRRDFVRSAVALSTGGAVAALGLAGCTERRADGGQTIDGESSSSTIQWDKEVDVLVVGSGACGLTAAVRLLDAGLIVTVVDRNDEPGGNSILSGGGYRTAAPVSIPWDVPWPADYSVEDGVKFYTDVEDSMLKKNNVAVCRAFVENAADTVQLFLDHEVVIKPKPGVSIPDMAFPAWEADPGPGFQQQLLGPDEYCSGSGLIRPLEAAVLAANGEILQNHLLTKLIRENGGRILGGEVDTGGATIHIKANRGIVMGSGSLKGNKWLRQIYDNRITEDLFPSGMPYDTNDGSAIVAALEVGASLACQLDDTMVFRAKFGTPWYNYRLDSGVAAPGISVTPAQADSFIYINKAGERFVDETAVVNPHDGAAGYFEAALLQEDHIVWTIFDKVGAEKNRWDINPPVCDEEYAFGADTLEELADKIGVSSGGLVAAVNEYNGFVDAGVDSILGKPADKLTAKIETGPFYGVRATTFIHDCVGGLAINANSQVMDIYGEAIPGLYSGGDAASGNCNAIGVARASIQGYIAATHLLTQ